MDLYRWLIRGCFPRRTINENDVDPSITEQLDLTRDVMVYATFAKGSKGGAFDPSNNKATAANFSCPIVCMHVTA